MSDDESAKTVAQLAERSHNTITICGRHSVHLAVHDKERAMRKAAERKAVRNYRREQVLISSNMFNGGAHPFTPFHPGMAMMPHQPSPFPFPDPSVASRQQQMQPAQQHARHQEPALSPQAPEFEPRTMKVSENGAFEILVENIPHTMTLHQLAGSFSSHGEIVGASLRVSFGEMGRTCYGRIRFSTHQSMAAAVMGRTQPSSIATAGRQPLEQDASYGLWRPKPTVRATSAPSRPPEVSTPPSVEGTLSSWSGSLCGAFTPTSRDRRRQTNNGPPGL